MNYDDLKKHLQREANINQISSNVNVAQQFYSRQKKSVTNSSFTKGGTDEQAINVS